MMITDAQLDAARARAATTLTDGAVITRPGAGTWSEADGMGSDHTRVWPPEDPPDPGPASYSPLTSDNTTTTGATDAAVQEWEVRLPANTPGIRPGDEIATTSNDPAVPAELIVRRTLGRTTRALRRLVAVDKTDVAAVPR